ncbi:Histidine kinase osmosensor [Xanthoria parietina]
MRIPIREQLGLLVLLTCLSALAVVTIATWVNNYHFVVGVRLSTLSLTASLYANQLRAGLVLMQSSVVAATTRVIIQNALRRYDYGNNTDANWVNAVSDLQSALLGRGASMLVQARVVSKNGTGLNGPYGLINVTAQDIMGQILLPYPASDGSPVYLGDNETGYPPSLYPNLTFTSSVLNDTFNESVAYLNGVRLYTNASLFLGPMRINSSLSLVSVTAPIINNTSDADILGWLTVVINGSSLIDLGGVTEGLGNTGEILVVGPTTQSGRLPTEVRSGRYDGKANRDLAKTQGVTYILPPANNSRSNRHTSRDWTQTNATFEMQQYPAILNGYSENKGALKTSGSVLSTRNEENKHISAGYALAKAPMVDWLLIVEQAYSEVHEPIDRLRNILLACVFGTAGLLVVLVFPIAHLSVRPIRRLQEATKKTVEPHRFAEDGGSVRSSFSAEDGPASGQPSDINAEEARKEGFLGRVTGWRTHRRERKEQEKRDRRETFRIPGKVQDRKHIVHDELTDLTKTFNQMSEELAMQYERLEERVRERTAQLEMSKKAAEAANESKTLFIANISHELKTPLNGILGMCAVCMHEDDPTKIKRSLGIIYKSGDLLLHLLTDLLQFSRNQMGQQLTLEEREFRLADVSNQILSIFEKQAKEGSINMSLLFLGPLDTEATTDMSTVPLQSGFGPTGTGRIRDMMLWGDQHRILQVIINLVSNSLKFTPPGGSVYVRIKCIGEDDDRPISRKGSTQSKQSHRNSSRTLRQRGRIISASESSSSPKSPERGLSGYSDTALQINAKEPKSIPTVAVHERGSSPPPNNARILIFEFEVEDTGPGIPENQQQRVFEPFMQGDLGLSKKYGGTGLGLSICSQLATLMKGSIRLSSQVGVGSKFTMQIPLIFTKERADSTTDSDLGLNSRRNSINVGSLRNESTTLQKNTSSSNVSIKSTDTGGAAPAVSGFDKPAKPRLVGLSAPFFASDPPLESPNQQIEAIERAAAQASEKGDKVRVLVAEDNKVNQEVVLRMLKLEDIYDVTVAKDGLEALDLVRVSMEERRYFNLIFMDVQMPNLDGLESTRRIRSMGYSAPIVALTAFAEESNVKECMESGMDFFLPKPIKRPALKQVLKKYCATIPEAVEPEPEKPQTAAVADGTSRTNGTTKPPMS